MSDAEKDLKELEQELEKLLVPKGYLPAEFVLEQLRQWWIPNRFGRFGREVAIFARKVAEAAGILEDHRREWTKRVAATWGSTGSDFDEALAKWKYRERLNPERLAEVEGVLLLAEQEA